MNSGFLAKVFGFDKERHQEQIKRASLVRIVLLTCVFGVVYSGVYIVIFDVWGSAVVTITYVLISIVNILIYFVGKNYNVFRIVQLFFILLLPILAQLSIGGFIASSGVGISAILAPVGALMFHNAKTARIFFYLFVVFLTAAGVIEYVYLDINTSIPRSMEITFFVIVMSSSMAVVYLLLEFITLEKKKVEDSMIKSNIRLKKFNSEIESQNFKLLAQQKEILDQQKILEEQNLIIKENNEEMTASITYASNIQGAMLPKDSKLKELLGDNVFSYYKPRDIVSGDFYWCEQIDGKVVLVSSDCTGHGVPGAFMSMLGVSGLNEVVLNRRITSPEMILNELHEYIFRSLSQDKGNSADGMDISVLLIDKELEEISFAGAMNPLYYVQSEQLVELKGDKKPIGGLQYGRERAYTKHMIKIDKPTMLYLSSDGYQDQFGGSSNKKFMKGRFKDTLKGISSQSTEDQKDALHSTLFNWIDEGREKQIDDVLILGVKF